MIISIIAIFGQNDTSLQNKMTRRFEHCKEALRVLVLQKYSLFLLLQNI
jgi:hypothetical protein